MSWQPDAPVSASTVDTVQPDALGCGASASILHSSHTKSTCASFADSGNVLGETIIGKNSESFDRMGYKGECV